MFNYPKSLVVGQSRIVKREATARLPQRGFLITLISNYKYLLLQTTVTLNFY